MYLIVDNRYVYILVLSYNPYSDVSNMVFLFDQFNMPDNVYDVVFATDQQVVVAKMLVQRIKEKGVFTKADMSEFAIALHDGVQVRVPVKMGSITTKTQQVISYNKRQFYDRILTPMKSMGLIEYDLYKKTYRLSDRFSKMMEKVGKMWLSQLKGPQKHS